MYSNNCVLAVLFNGTPCKELANGTVPLPFNSEYVIRVRNKDKKRRLVAKIKIDDENISEGGIVVEPGSYVDLEGPVYSDKRFKFVSLDSPDAVDFGKNGPNKDKVKGVIEASCHFEKITQSVEHHHHYYPRPIIPWSPRGIPRTQPWVEQPWESDQFRYGNNLSCQKTFEPQLMSGGGEMDNLADGCTVEGSYTNQTFTRAHLEYESECTVLKLFLQGYDSNANYVNVSPKTKKNGKRVETEYEDAELIELRMKRIEMEKQLERKKIKELEDEINKIKK